MTRKCGICTHKKKDQINDSLINKPISGESYRLIAERFGVSESALLRHNENCITELVSKSKNLMEKIGPESLNCQLKKHETTIKDCLERALSENDIRTAHFFIADALAAMRFKAELEGKIHDRAVNVQVNNQINLLQSPEWTSLRDRILEALNNFPEAREAVLNAING